MSFWKDNVKPMRAELHRLFPKCFVAEGDKTRKKRALKIGIHLDIFEKAPGLDQKIVKLALRDYIQGRKYLSACFDGATRVDLDGKPAGLVASAHRHYHVRKNDQREKKLKRMRDEQAKVAIPETNRQVGGSPG